MRLSNLLRPQAYRQVHHDWCEGRRLRFHYDPTKILPVVPLQELIKNTRNLQLQSMTFIDGNVSPLEILAIAAITAEQQPKCVLEIGTFNGNSTLQMALNSPSDAKILTLDLPLDAAEIPTKTLDENDGRYIVSTNRRKRQFVGHPLAGKIRELFGDSATFDFRAALEGQTVDLAFIDGSHSYEYVKSDAERILQLMSSGGVILWHDYQACWDGVCRYLNELSRSLPVQRIEGTCLAYYRTP
jgi:predicted O-methyltransferase YrrM